MDDLPGGFAISIWEDWSSGHGGQSCMLYIGKHQTALALRIRSRLMMDHDKKCPPHTLLQYMISVTASTMKCMRVHLFGCRDQVLGS